MKKQAQHPDQKSGVKVRSLPFDLWPAADQTAWQIACRPSVRLKRGGSASHFRQVTRDDLASRYGYFLDFLARSNCLNMTAAAASQVVPRYVEPYVTELKARVRSVTVYGSISKLRRMTQLIAPDRDLGWLIEIERELASEMIPRSKYGRLVLANVLIEAGMTLMVEAQLQTSTRPTDLTRATMFRNGLMIALLAHCPIRLKNFAALEIGRSILKVDTTWWIILAGSETKEKRPDERPIPDFLTQWIDVYVESYRPILLGADRQSKYLWIGRVGRPLTQASVSEVVAETTRSIVGVSVSPHLFRSATVSSAALYGENTLHLGSALLHHRHSSVTESNYIRTGCVYAAKAYAAITEKYRAHD